MLPHAWLIVADQALHQWRGHHNGQVVCMAHADHYQRQYFEPLSVETIFDFEFDMGQYIGTIAECWPQHEMEQHA